MPVPRFLSTLRALSWAELGGYAFATFAMGHLAILLAPAAFQTGLRHASLILALCVLAAKDLAHAPEAWRRLRAAIAERAPWQRILAALLPPELVGLLKLDRLMWVGCLHRLRRRPQAASPDGVALTYLQRGAYGTASAIAFVMVFIELPLDAMIVNLFVKDPDHLLVVHVLCAAAALYTLAWVIGDRWHLGAGRHVLTADALHLDVGVRASGVLPLASIERMETVNEPLTAWRRKHGAGRGATLVVTPFDKPNCVLVLKPEAELGILHWQVRKRVPQYVFLYLDRPELLAARLRADP
jgi:hypothetical protein